MKTLDIYCFALDTDKETLEKVYHKSKTVRIELNKAFLGVKNNLPEIFEKWEDQ